MTTLERTRLSGNPSLHRKVRFVGVYYSLTLVASAIVLFVRGRLAFAVDLGTAVSYIAATAFLYALSTHGLSKSTRRPD